MKIIENGKIYVQKNDIALLNETDLAIPASIYVKVYGAGIVIIDNSNRFEFVEFTEKEEIEFFKSLDWIVDYNQVKNLSEEEIKELTSSTLKEKNKIVN